MAFPTVYIRTEFLLITGNQNAFFKKRVEICE